MIAVPALALKESLIGKKDFAVGCHRDSDWNVVSVPIDAHRLIRGHITRATGAINIDRIVDVKHRDVALRIECNF